MRVLGMERHDYSLIQAQLGRLSVQWADEGSGLLSEGAIDRSSYALFMQLNEHPVLLNGIKLGPNAIAVLPPNSEFCFSFGPREPLACDKNSDSFALQFRRDSRREHAQFRERSLSAKGRDACASRFGD